MSLRPMGTTGQRSQRTRGQVPKIPFLYFETYHVGTKYDLLHAFGRLDVSSVDESVDQLGVLLSLVLRLVRLLFLAV